MTIEDIVRLYSVDVLTIKQYKEFMKNNKLNQRRINEE
jgi:hypothetical protein